MNLEDRTKRNSGAAAPEIVLQAVGKSFGGKPVLRGIDIKIERGSFVALLGHSGSGKSTLLRMLADLSDVTEGTISLDGVTPAEYLQHTAFMFQDPTLLPWKRVIANASLPLKLQGLDKTQREQIARRWLAEVGLADAENKYPRQLSGGMKMRVSLARMLVRQPRLILYDEPFSALDEINRLRLNELIAKLYAEQRPTSLFVTHSVSEAVFLAERILVLGGNPAHVVGDFTLPWDFPRKEELRSSSEYIRWVDTISQCMRGAANNGNGGQS